MAEEDIEHRDGSSDASAGPRIASNIAVTDIRDGFGRRAAAPGRYNRADWRPRHGHTRPPFEPMLATNPAPRRSAGCYDAYRNTSAYLLDPADGPFTTVPWRSDADLDWQRLGNDFM